MLHGGANDVMWLQRDFRLFLVNVFDTEKACQVCGRCLVGRMVPVAWQELGRSWAGAGQELGTGVRQEWGRSGA